MQSAPPRLIAPLSTSTVTSQSPTLHWQLAAESVGAHVELCADPACTQITQQFDAMGASTAVPTALTPGVHFWHARSIDGSAYGPTWEFWVGHRSAPVDTSWGTRLDVNRDGYSDVAIAAPGTAMGVVYVYVGGPTGVASNPSSTVMNPQGRPEFATEMASAGDTDGDGYPELMVAAVGAGSVYVFRGGMNGVGQTPVVLPLPADSLMFGHLIAAAGDVNETQFPMGSMVNPIGAGAGDTNGDGYDDLVFGGTNQAFVIRGGTTMGITMRVLEGILGSEFGQSVAFINATARPRDRLRVVRAKRTTA